MPTQEERLQTVEFDLKRYQTETIKAYGDMAMEFVMLKGLTEDGVKRLMVVKKTLDEHTATLNEHTATLNEHTARFDHIETRFDEHTTRLDRIEILLTRILERLP